MCRYAVFKFPDCKCICHACFLYCPDQQIETSQPVLSEHNITMLMKGHGETLERKAVLAGAKVGHRITLPYHVIYPQCEVIERWRVDGWPFEETACGDCVEERKVTQKDDIKINPFHLRESTIKAIQENVDDVQELEEAEKSKNTRRRKRPLKESEEDGEYKISGAEDDEADVSEPEVQRRRANKKMANTQPFLVVQEQTRKAPKKRRIIKNGESGGEYKPEGIEEYDEDMVPAIKVAKEVLKIVPEAETQFDNWLTKKEQETKKKPTRKPGKKDGIYKDDVEQGVKAPQNSVAELNETNNKQKTPAAAKGKQEYSAMREIGVVEEANPEVEIAEVRQEKNAVLQLDSDQSTEQAHDSEESEYEVVKKKSKATAKMAPANRTAGNKFPVAKKPPARKARK